MAAGITRPEDGILVPDRAAARGWAAGEVFRTAAPLILSSGAGAIKLFCDRLMLTWHSDVSMVAALSGGMAAFLLASPFLGISAYASSFVSQFRGAGRETKIGGCIRQSLLISIASGLVVALLGWGLSSLFAHCGHPRDLVAQETRYFLSLTCGSVLTLSAVSLSCFWIGRGRAWTVVAVNIGGLLLCVGLNRLLIFGVDGVVPALGIAGAAASTLTVDGLKAALFLALFLGTTDRARTGRFFDPALAYRMLRFGLGNGVQLLLGIGAVAAFQLLVGGYGTDANGAAVASASGIAFSVASLAGIPLLGMGTAVSLLVAGRLGEGNVRQARRTVESARRLCTLYAALVGAAFLLFPAHLVAFFHRDGGLSPETVRLACSFLALATLPLAADSLSIPYGGAIRGAGDTGFAVKVMATTGCGLFIVPCFVAFFAGAGAFALWGVAALSAFSTALLYRRRYRQGRWESLRLIDGGGGDAPAAPASSPAWGNNI